jgi:AAA family ATP:ADP antiporter
MLGMFVYIELAKSAATLFASAAERTAFFATRDLWVNAASFCLQLFLVGAIAKRLGVRTALLLSVTVALLAFGALSVLASVGALLSANGALRATEFGLGKPARDMLWTVVSTAEKYKVKNVVDTVVYRGADVLGGWTHAALAGAGLSLAGMATVSSATCAGLLVIAYLVSLGYQRRGGA